MKYFNIGKPAATLVALMMLPGCDSLGGNSIPSAKSVASAITGSLTVAIYGDFGKKDRSTAAYASDVDSLVLTVRQDGEEDKVATVDPDTMISGNASVKYDEIPAGTVRATLTAYDEDKAPLGTTSLSTQILAGKHAVMPLVLRLDPNYVDPASMSIQAGTGSMTLHAYVLDGVASTNSVNVTVYQDASQKWRFLPHALAVRQGAKLYLKHYLPQAIPVLYGGTSTLMMISNGPPVPLKDSVLSPSVSGGSSTLYVGELQKGTVTVKVDAAASDTLTINVFE